MKTLTGQQQNKRFKDKTFSLTLSKKQECFKIGQHSGDEWSISQQKFKYIPTVSPRHSTPVYQRKLKLYVCTKLNMNVHSNFFIIAKVGKSPNILQQGAYAYSSAIKR